MYIGNPGGKINTINKKNTNITYLIWLKMRSSKYIHSRVTGGDAVGSQVRGNDTRAPYLIIIIICIILKYTRRI